MLTLKEAPVRQQQPKPKQPTPERLAESAGGHEEEIRPLAYRKWQEAGSPAGDGVQFWLAAEKEILRGRRP